MNASNALSCRRSGPCVSALRFPLPVGTLSPASPTGPPQLAFTGWKGWEYVLQRSPALVNPVWAGVATARVESLMWAAGQLGDPGPAAGGTFHYRLFSRVRGE